jgi:hypothetical protein
MPHMHQRPVSRGLWPARQGRRLRAGPEPSAQCRSAGRPLTRQGVPSHLCRGIQSRQQSPRSSSIQASWLCSESSR